MGAEMIKFERILCPTNLSPESDEALRYGVALARAYHAKLFILYCGEGAAAGDSISTAGIRRNVKGIFEDGLSSHLGLSDFASLDWEGIVVENGQVVKGASE